MKQPTLDNVTDPRPVLWRPWPAASVRTGIWLVWTALLSGFLVAMAAPALGDFPRVSGDDAWIMSASHKLATEGVFGSDLYRGYADAEHHYFIALPVYHFLQAGVFALTGTSVAAARAVTLVSGIVVLWCVAWLARRWHGVAVAVVAVGLLVLWRTYLLNLASGLSFLSASRTGRYDMTAVAFVLLAIVVLEHLSDDERPRLAVLAGVLAGLATLTQFFGAFVIPVVAALLLIEWGWRVYREPVARWLAAGWLTVVVPYGVYVAANWSAFKGQSELKSGRVEFGQPMFYLDNLLDEPDRYRHLFSSLSPVLDGQYHRFDQPLSPFIFGVAGLFALGLLAARVARGTGAGEHRLLIVVTVLAVCLALFDGTNATLYSVLLLPFLCIAIALLAATGLRWATRQPPIPVAIIVSLLVVAPAVIVVREGVAAHRHEREWSAEIVRYGDAAGQIESQLPDGAVVLGMERWWAGLYQDHDYVAVSAIARQLVESSDREQSDELTRVLEIYGIRAIVVDDDYRSTVRRLPDWLRVQFEEIVQHGTVHVGTVTLHVYGQVDVYVIR